MLSHAMLNRDNDGRSCLLSAALWCSILPSSEWRIVDRKALTTNISAADFAPDGKALNKTLWYDGYETVARLSQSWIFTCTDVLEHFGFLFARTSKDTEKHTYNKQKRNKINLWWNSVFPSSKIPIVCSWWICDEEFLSIKNNVFERNVDWDSNS
jgi:hypothetical protein